MINFISALSKTMVLQLLHSINLRHLSLNSHAWFCNRSVGILWANLTLVWCEPVPFSPWFRLLVDWHVLVQLTRALLHLSHQTNFVNCTTFTDLLFFHEHDLTSCGFNIHSGLCSWTGKEAGEVTQRRGRARCTTRTVSWWAWLGFSTRTDLLTCTPYLQF